MEHSFASGLHFAERIIKSAYAEKAERSVLEEEHLFRDYLPTELREKHQLCEYNYAIKQIHFPDDMETLIEARKRLVFDELFFIYLKPAISERKKGKKRKSVFFPVG